MKTAKKTQPQSEEVTMANAKAQPQPQEVRYILTDKARNAIKERSTKQGAKTGLGAKWRDVASDKPSTRHLVLTALDGKGPSTEQELMSLLVPLHKAGALGSGTPRSYFMAFIASGYIQVA